MNLQDFTEIWYSIAKLVSKRKSTFSYDSDNQSLIKKSRLNLNSLLENVLKKVFQFPIFFHEFQLKITLDSTSRISYTNLERSLS